MIGGSGEKAGERGSDEVVGVVGAGQLLRSKRSFVFVGLPRETPFVLVENLAERRPESPDFVRLSGPGVPRRSI